MGILASEEYKIEDRQRGDDRKMEREREREREGERKE
jgi:hypothetical protein